MAMTFLARGGLVATALVAALLAGSSRQGAALADEPPAGAARAEGTATPCVLAGAQAVAKGVTIFDAREGGRVIATFTGAVVPLRASELPADASTGRARVATSNGAPSLRIDGYVQASALSVYTTRDVPVYAGHVWIAAAEDVTLARTGQGGLTVEHAVMGSQGQKVQGSAPCEAFALERGRPTALDAGAAKRGYMMKHATIDLYDAPKGDAVLSLRMIEGSGQLFWGQQVKGPFVQVTMRTDLVIDAWARTADLDALKKGEMLDQLAPPERAVAGAQLAFESPPRVARATKDVPVRAARDEKEKPIGAVESGAEIYVLETVAGWTHVLPKSLGLVPPEGGGFWIPSGETPP